MSGTVQGTYGTMYYVRNMKKAVAYYQEVCGLTPRFVGADWTEFELGDGTALCLHDIQEGRPQAGGIHIIRVTDIEKKVADLKAKGVEFVRDTFEVHPGAYAADFKDPDGNVVSVYENKNG